MLVPNERGLDRALAAGVGAVAVFGSATETFARKNLNRRWPSRSRCSGRSSSGSRAEGLWVRAYVSMCFGDPWEGAVPVEQVVDVCRRLMDLGCDQLSPRRHHRRRAPPGTCTGCSRRSTPRGIGADRVGVHFHDTYGQALANTMAALRDGVTVVDASAGGLGGCPYAKSATGNLATEDLVWALEGAGVETGVDLDALVETSVWMAEQSAAAVAVRRRAGPGGRLTPGRARLHAAWTPDSDVVRCRGAPFGPARHGGSLTWAMSDPNTPVPDPRPRAASRPLTTLRRCPAERPREPGAAPAQPCRPRWGPAPPMAAAPPPPPATCPGRPGRRALRPATWWNEATSTGGGPGGPGPGGRTGGAPAWSAWA